MKNIIILTAFGLCGCVGPQRLHTIDTADRIEVVKASVQNPYPLCTKEQHGIRIANLSLERGLRVYLEDGQLCQR